MKSVSRESRGFSLSLSVYVCVFLSLCICWRDRGDCVCVGVHASLTRVPTAVRETFTCTREDNADIRLSSTRVDLSSTR